MQHCLRHDPEGAFRLLYYGLALRGLEALPAPEQLVAPHSAEAAQISVRMGGMVIAFSGH